MSVSELEALLSEPAVTRMSRKARPHLAKAGAMVRRGAASAAALGCFTTAGFLFNPIAGFITAGVSLLAFEWMTTG